jgi:hypothetical protein
MAKRIFPFWGTDDIADIGDGSPNKLNPGLAKQAIGWTVETPKLQHMNWLQELCGHFIRGNNEVKGTATGVEVEAGQRILANNLAATCTIDLPTEPQDGQWVEISGAGLYSLFNVLVDGGTIDIMVTSDKVCTLDEGMDNSVFIFWYSSTLSMWRIRISKLDGVVAV